MWLMPVPQTFLGEHKLAELGCAFETQRFDAPKFRARYSGGVIVDAYTVRFRRLRTHRLYAKTLTCTLKEVQFARFWYRCRSERNFLRVSEPRSHEKAAG
jgi:hypothetical protein